jgi:DNA invertase Pin-like site-specific DNA recombinase
MNNKQGQTVAYIRVSGVDQNLARQQELADRADKVFPEKESGKEGGDRPVLLECIDWVRSGDTVLVWSIDRLARSIVDLNRIVSELRGKGVSVHFEKEQMTFKPDEEADPYTEAMFNMLGTFAQFERRIIRQRQLEGIAIAKAAGKYKGQKPKLFAAQLVELREREAAGIPKARIAREMGVSRKTVYRALDPAYMSIEQWHESSGKTLGRRASSYANDLRLKREDEERIARAHKRDMVRALATDTPPALTFEQTGDIDDVAYYAEANGAPDPTVEQISEVTGIGVEVVASNLADSHYLDRDRWEQLREEADDA